MNKNADGTYNADGSFTYDYEGIAAQTGYTVNEVKMYGVSYCRRNPNPPKRK